MSELAKGLGEQCARANVCDQDEGNLIFIQSGVRLDVVTLQRLPIP